MNEEDIQPISSEINMYLCYDMYAEKEKKLLCKKIVYKRVRPTMCMCVGRGKADESGKALHEKMTSGLS